MDESDSFKRNLRQVGNNGRLRRLRNMPNDPHIHLAVECVLAAVLLLIGFLGWSAAQQQREEEQKNRRR